MYAASLLLFFFGSACDSNLIFDEEDSNPPSEGDIRIAAVGDSITHNLFLSYPYPEQLDEMLGQGYTVENFGESNYAAQASSDFPYDSTDSYQESLDFNPDIVLIMLGTNDTKSHNWNGKEQFREEYTELLESYLELPSVSRVILASPPAAFLGEVVGGSIDSNYIQSIRDTIEEIAVEYDLTFIDMVEETASHPEWFPDGVHPNDEGSEALARVFYEHIEE